MKADALDRDHASGRSPLRISAPELERRRGAVLDAVRRAQAAAFVSFAPTSIFYLSNYQFGANERPTALTVSDGATRLFVPTLKREHAEAEAQVDAVDIYPEYPGDRHPMLALAERLQALGLGRAAIVAESSGYASAQGYAGPAIAEVLPEAKVRIDRQLVERLRMVKSAEEIAILRQCYRWADRAHRLLQERCRPGSSELDISTGASVIATKEMIDELSRTHTVHRPIRAYANFGSGGGQVGRDSGPHHSGNPNPMLRTGDLIITFVSAQIAGYRSELERTLVVGEPSAEQRRFFSLMLEAQNVALAALRPGVACAAVDAAVRRFYEKNGLLPYWRHHTGHSLGLLEHEAPFLDVGDQTVLRPGMIVTVEPGLYVPELGGFRNSDSALITENGLEILTAGYPRDIDSLSCR